MDSKKSAKSSKKPAPDYTPQPIVLAALDGFLLSGSLFLPPGPIFTNPPPAAASPDDPSHLSSTARFMQVEPLTKVVIINSATATIQDFYYKFASYLSQELGMIVITYDNRGIGRSMPNSDELISLKAVTDNTPFTSGTAAPTSVSPKSSAKAKSVVKPKVNPLIGFEASIMDWALLDLPGVFSYVLGRFPHNPTLFVGHSVGGYILPAIDPYYTRNLERVLFVSVTASYWRYMNNPLFTYWFFIIASPIVNSYYGYYPGKSLWGTMEDMPKGCFETWTKWVSVKNYMLDGNPEWKPNFDLFKTPLYSLYFSDDDFSSTTAPMIMKIIPNTLRRCVGLDPVKDLNMKRIGHMGFFSNMCKEKLWETVVRAWFVDGHALDRDTIKKWATMASRYARL
ncbi:hypothetical protein B0O80DRAFT_434495 [Mortierella sp. GBAus27b]|nr:hypothetical protein BGX31_004395 [Mortierella sp. GBA43]KAI8361847.1 hypothetical protein B0O80DRAFT_434495 [Mortierella sp. GBAus27b]